MNFVSLTNWFGGRSTFFGLAFFAVGCVLAFQHNLTANYISLSVATQTLLVTRAVMDDYHERETKKIGNGTSNGG